VSEKSCTVCRKTKPLCDYSPCRNGYQPSCKQCRNNKASSLNAIVTASEKRCRTCEETKLACDFNRSKHRSDGLQSECKACDKARKALRNYEVTLTDKTCVDCGITKPADCFARDRHRVGGIRKECRECSSIRCRASIYKLSYEACRLLCSRDGCEICRRELRKSSDKHIDHCHASGVVRGTLCAPCNKMLGAAFDSPETLESAARYLRAKRTGAACG
jgi:hypothetical protein